MIINLAIKHAKLKFLTFISGNLCVFINKNILKAKNKQLFII